jgi:hypothetical protein
MISQIPCEGIRVKRIVLLSVLGLVLFYNTGLFAQPNFFWNANCGMTLTRDAYVDNSDFGIGFLLSPHFGIEIIKYVSFETGVDFFAFTNFSYNYTWEEARQIDPDPVSDRNERDEVHQYQYSSIDIPFMVNFILPVSDRFTLKPALGMYLSFPVEVDELPPQKNPPKLSPKRDSPGDESQEIYSKYLLGIQTGIKISYNLKEKSVLEKSTIYFGANLKWDIYPTRIQPNVFDERNTFTRMTIPIFIGYERKI